MSGLENAYLSYTGFKPFGGKLAIEGGIMDLPYTLDEATSSNDILFMERASSGVIATNIAAGDFRSAVGARWYNDRFWAGAYVTGPTTGAIHSASSVNPNGTTEQFGAVARAAGQIVSGKDYSLHLGGDAQWLIQPPHNLVTGAQTLTLSDRPELRIDPTTLISTGALAGVSGAQVYSVEAAGTYRLAVSPGRIFLVQCRSQRDRRRCPSVKFHGGYAQAGYVLTGETRQYNPGSASYGGVVPANPFSLDGGGWGAWEIAGRVQHHRSQRSARHRQRRRRRAADRLHAGAELVRQSQRPLHVRLPARQRRQADQPDQLRRCRFEVRRVRDADAGGVVTHRAGVVATALPAAAVLSAAPVARLANFGAHGDSSTASRFRRRQETQA